MKRYHRLLPLLLLLTSCSEAMYLTIEQLLPPETKTGQMAHSIGIINNFSRNNVIIQNEGMEILPCNADSVKEQIALSFAEADILDRVVVFDSLLYHPDSIHPHILTQAEVNDLCKRLEVDMLYSVDYACLSFYPGNYFMGRPIDIHLCSRIYTPDTDSIKGSGEIRKKSIEQWLNLEELNTLIPQVPSLLAEAAVTPYLPSWKERERIFYYDRFCYELREAKVYIKEGDWEAAARQWQALSTSKQRIRRFEAAYNMALYYEMSDSIDRAITSLDLAKEIAVKKGKDGTEIQLIDTTLADEYRKVLVNRKKEIAEIEQFWREK